MKRKKISIFGSSGSIGKSTIEVLKNNLDAYEIVALVVNNNVEALISQAKLLIPTYAIIRNESYYEEVKEALKDYPTIEVKSGQEAINKIARVKCDLFICAIVGLSALKPTINAIKVGSNIGLANKECLVAAGDIMIREAKRNKVKLIPIDSEHNAIFQIYERKNLKLIDSITLTASGGPFFRMAKKNLKNITKEQAIKHPNWSMGAKISVDSATIMNKALEMIEAYRLFPVNIDQIKVVIHPESIIHGLVDYQDGSTLSMMSIPDMKVPISYAIGYPKRIKIKYQKLDLAKIRSLNFFKAREEKFTALKLARRALKIGGNAPAVLNAANEVAVARFLNGEILFTDILKINMEVLKKVPYYDIHSLEDVLQFDQEARVMAQNLLKKDGTTITN